MPRMLLFLSLSVAASVGLCANAHADHWRVCNQTPEDLFVAIGYQDTENHSISRGWGTLDKCSCVRVLDYDKTKNPTVYLYAETNAKIAKFGAEHPQLCVSNPGPFVYRNGPGESCPSGGRVVGFAKVTLRDWPNTYTTNLESSVGACHEGAR
jgi:uncharacterized membrane protein